MNTCKRNYLNRKQKRTGVFKRLGKLLTRITKVKEKRTQICNVEIVISFIFI